MTGFPSATALALTLGADSPCADERCAGNLGLSATGPFTLFIATHVSIRTSDGSSIPLETPSQPYGTLLYHLNDPLKALAQKRAVREELLAEQKTLSGGSLKSAASVIGLSPVTSSAQDDSISELLRFL